MIIKDQKFAVTEFNEIFVNPQPNIQRTWVERCDLHIRKAKEFRDRRVHNELRQDIIEHLWNLNH